MAGKRKNPIWRQVFLRALSRTGNVRASAAEAGVNTETAYGHRARDPGFAAKWEAALARGKAVAARAKARRAKGAGELVLRRSKNGDQMVRAAAGRWCARTEEVFFAELERTGCVEAAAAAAGISTNALYYRRRQYPEFAEKWDRVVATAKQQIPDMLAAATIASLRPEPAGPAGRGKRRGRGGLPKVDIDQAIRIAAMQDKAGEAGGRRRGGIGRERQEVSDEELLEALERQLDALGRRLRKEQARQGWVETEEGHWIPPGWVRSDAGPEAPGAVASGD